MKGIPKKRAVISYENMSPELQDAFKEKYPLGYSDYAGDLFKVDKPDGTSFYAVSLEFPDALYLIKIKVKIDDYEEVEKTLFKDDNDDDGEGADGDGGFPASDEDIAAAEESESDD